MNVSGEIIALDLGKRTAPPRVPVPSAPVTWSLPGLCPMTRVLCSFGEVYAAALRERDPVRVRNGGYRPIKWLDRIELCPDFLARHPESQPLLISAGSFGPGKPKADIMLSPGQLVASLPGAIQRPTSTRRLLHHPGVFRRPQSSVTYTIFDLGEPAEISVEGLWLSNAPIRAEDVPQY